MSSSKLVPGPSPKTKVEAKGPHPSKNNVIDLATLRCKAEGCNKKSSRADFCEEHFEWFKMGLITKEGKKVPDFDKKMLAFETRKKAA
jgi:hypothetical protein